MSPHLRRVFTIAICLIAFCSMLSVLADPRFIAAGFDPSWEAVAAEGLVSTGYSVTNLAATVGALSPIYTGYFVRDFYPTLIGLSLVIAASYAWSNTLLFGNAHPDKPFNLFDSTLVLVKVILVQVFIIAFAWRDPLLHVVCLFYAAGYAIGSPKRAILYVSVGATAVAILCLAKLSVLASALPAVFFIDSWRLFIDRKFPAATPLFLGALAVGAAACGYDLSNLKTLLSLNGEIISGYASAMALRAPLSELVPFLLACSAVLISVLMRDAWSSLGGFGYLKRGLVAVLLSGFIFAIFKAGFVRGDAHTVVSWAGLAAAIAILGGMKWSSIGTSNARALGLTVLVLLTMYWVTALKLEMRTTALAGAVLTKYHGSIGSLLSFAAFPTELHPVPKTPS